MDLDCGISAKWSSQSRFPVKKLQRSLMSLPLRNLWIFVTKVSTSHLVPCITGQRATFKTKTCCQMQPLPSDNIIWDSHLFESQSVLMLPTQISRSSSFKTATLIFLFEIWLSLLCCQCVVWWLYQVLCTTYTVLDRQWQADLSRPWLHVCVTVPEAMLSLRHSVYSTSMYGKISP